MPPYRTKLYIETSVVSYLTARPSRDLVAAARQQITREWWDTHIREFDAFISSVVLDEAADGDDSAAKKRLEVLDAFPVLELTPQVESLADAYLKNAIIPAVSPIDAFHLSFAVAYEMDMLVTWNFRHLASAFIQRQLRSFNEREGFQTPVICTPEELLGD